MSVDTMPHRFLQVNMSSVAAVDSGNVENVLKIWRIFANAGETVEHGRRFENLSWRLWNKEALVGEEVTSTTRRNKSTLSRTEFQADETPALSSSVDSAASDSDAAYTHANALPIRPSPLSRRSSQLPPSPADLVRLMDKVTSDNSDVRSWKRKTPDLSSPSHEFIHAVTDSQLPVQASSASSSCSTSSTTSVESDGSIVVRGFSPSKTNMTTPPSPPTFEKVTSVEKPKPKSVFMVGPESYSSCGSFTQPSNLTNALLSRRTYYSDDAISDDDTLSESAIEDDDEEDWEDSSAENSYVDNNMFTRVDPTARIPSNRSLLSTILKSNRTRSTPAIHRREGPSMAQTPREAIEVPSRSKPMPIASALSPRTTRQHMIKNELTESLRKNMVWERQQKSKTNLAALRRRHTAQDFAALNKTAKVDESAPYRDSTAQYEWTEDFDQYHTSGW